MVTLLEPVKPGGAQTHTFGSGYLLVVGVFPVKGWGPKSSACPMKAAGYRDFGWDIPGKKLKGNN